MCCARDVDLFFFCGGGGFDVRFLFFCVVVAVILRVGSGRVLLRIRLGIVQCFFWGFGFILVFCFFIRDSQNGDDGFFQIRRRFQFLLSCVLGFVGCGVGLGSRVVQKVAGRGLFVELVWGVEGVFRFRVVVFVLLFIFGVWRFLGLVGVGGQFVCFVWRGCLLRYRNRQGIGVFFVLFCIEVCREAGVFCCLEIFSLVWGVDWAVVGWGLKCFCFRVEVCACVYIWVCIVLGLDERQLRVRLQFRRLI